MTGKDLILYILENDLENSPVYEHNRFIGFMTVDEVALQLNIGVAAVCALVEREVLDHIYVGTTLFIPANFNKERKEK